MQFSSRLLMLTDINRVPDMIHLFIVRHSHLQILQNKLNYRTTFKDNE